MDISRMNLTRERLDVLELKGYGEHMIIVRDLKKTFHVKEGKIFRKKTRDVEAVKGIDLDIKEGEITGLIGVNGAGKTTTIKMLTTLLEPTSGSILIDDLDAVSNHMKAKEKINLITGGERNLYWRLTAKENLNYFGSLYGLSEKMLAPRIDYLLKMLNLSENADMPVERFSKGMKQRLQIARGLINDPKYVFLDEPTLGLDIIIAKEMRDYMKVLAKSENKGLLLTTHYMSEIEDLCDFVYIIHQGEIIAKGTVEEIKQKFQAHFQHTFVISSAHKESIEKLRIKLENRNVKIVDSDNHEEVITVSKENQLIAILQTFEEVGIEVISVRSEEPSLENTIFDLLKSE